MRHDHGAAAECFLTLFGFDMVADDGSSRLNDASEHARALAAGIRLAEGLHDLKLTRLLLTPKK